MRASRRSRASDERGNPELEGSLLGRGDTEILFLSGLEVCFAEDVAPQKVYSDRLDLDSLLSEVRLSALLMMLSLDSPDSIALRAAIILFDHLRLALLAACLPLPLSPRETPTRAFSGYRAVLEIVGYPGDIIGVL